MDRYPTISVIIPSWNQGRFIRRTLLSIIRQEYPSPVQIIVSDGGSSDETVSILKEFEDFITWWSAKDKGFADAVMKGSAKATGEILAIQSSDDYYLPGAFLEMAEAFAKNPSAGFVSGGECSIDLSGKIITSSMPSGAITPGTILYKYIPPQHATFIKRSLFEAVGGVRAEVDMCADIDLWYRASHINPGVYFTKLTAIYQLHPDQRTIVSDKWLQNLIKMVESCEQIPLYANHFKLTADQKKDLFAYWELKWTTNRNYSEGRKVAIKKIPRMFTQSIRTNRLLVGILFPASIKDRLKKLFSPGATSLKGEENVPVNWCSEV